MLYLQKFKEMGRVILFSLLCLVGPFVQAQHEENPYLLRYGDDMHWTQELPWHNTINANTIKNLYQADENDEWVVDSVVFHQAMQEISSNGGGVIYFPKGVYKFNYDVTLPSGIILRGDEPKGIADAKSNNYRLQTLFAFPKYKPTMSRIVDTLIFENAPNETAFKSVLATPGATGIGLVNIDLNRVVIDWSLGSKTSKNSPKYHSKVILFGIRQNNAVIPDPKIPSKFQQEAGNDWQRWPELMTGNINVSVNGLTLIANCKLNDETTDSYRQLGYKINDGMSFDGSYAMFDYTNHVGIRIEEPDNGMSRASVADMAIPVKEKKPLVEMRDNFVRVREGNNLIHGNAAIKSADNDMEHSKPTYENRTHDGLNAANVYYDVLMRDSSRTIAGYKRYRTGDTLPYRLMKPLDYDPNKSYPLVICLHGTGERGKDNWSQMKQYSWFWAREELQKDYPCFLLMPQHSENYLSLAGGFMTDAKNWMTLSMFEVMDELEEEYSIDPSRVYLTGISSGAFAVWELICHYPEKFAAAVPIAGYKRFDEFSRRRRKIEKNGAKQVPTWAFHGELDEWIPTNYARLTISEIKKAGGDPKFTQFNGIGHLCWDDLTQVDDFLPWLFSQKKAPDKKK